MTHTNPTLAVHATGLVKDFADNRAVDGIDLEVRRGEIFGVLGPTRTRCVSCSVSPGSTPRSTRT